MKNKFVSLAVAALIAAFPLSVAACGENAADGKTLVRINEVTHSVFYAPMYLADGLGYFAEEGIEIELTNGGGADATMAAVLSGGADIGFCGPEAAIYVEIGGSNDQPTVFGQLTKRDGSFLVGRSEQPDFEWSDLEGKEVLAGRKGGVPAMTFEYALKEQGVNATLNYDVAFNMMTAAFESGVADYCTMFEPVASEYEAAGKGFIVASVGQQSGEVPYTCFMAKRSYIDANPEIIDGFLKAVTKAIKYVNETPSDEAAEKLAPYFDGTSVQSLEISLESYKAIDAWVTNMAMEESALDRLQDIIESAGELERRVNFDDIVMRDAAQRAYEQVYAK